jgi:hypothetical protein
MKRTELAIAYCRAHASDLQHGGGATVHRDDVAAFLLLVPFCHPMPRSRIEAMAAEVRDEAVSPGDLYAFAAALEAGIPDEQDAKAMAFGRLWYRGAYNLPEVA